MDEKTKGAILSLGMTVTGVGMKMMDSTDTTIMLAGLGTLAVGAVLVGTAAHLFSKQITQAVKKGFGSK